MSESGTRGLFPMDDGQSPGNVIKYRETGIIPFQGIKALVAEKMIAALPQIEPSQIQPASLDLRLGPRAYRVRASFLPGPNSTVMEKVKQLDGLPAISLAPDPHAPGNGVVFEKGAVYVVELAESVRLVGDYVGFANPKSSTGRIDVLTRLITDHATAFDRVEKGYKGPLYLEVIPLTFSIVVRQGTGLNQLRLQRGSTAIAPSEIQRLYEGGQLVKIDQKLPPLRAGLVPLTVNLKTATPGEIIGFRAKKNSSKIDLEKIGHYDPREFWEPIESSNGLLNLDRNDFYILATREEVGVPPNLAAEMVAFDPASGEFRVHYAGFFDPGFGWHGTGAGGHAGGSRAVLEVRSYGVSFTLEHGQIVGWLDYKQLATAQTQVRYGDAIKSNYQGQGVALAKFFKPWPGSTPFTKL
jgi:dCTP deaminase